MSPQRLKAVVDFSALAARLKAAPFQNRVIDGVFHQPASRFKWRSEWVGQGSTEFAQSCAVHRSWKETAPIRGAGPGRLVGRLI